MSYHLNDISKIPPPSPSAHFAAQRHSPFPSSRHLSKHDLGLPKFNLRNTKIISISYSYISRDSLWSFWYYFTHTFIPAHVYDVLMFFTFCISWKSRSWSGVCSFSAKIQTSCRYTIVHATLLMRWYFSIHANKVR